MKKYKIKYMPDAERDLAQIYDYVERTLESPMGAERIIDMIMAKCRSLRIFPRTGKIWGMRQDKELRMLRVRKYIVFYYVENVTVVIFRVLYAKRNVGEILKVEKKEEK